MINYPYGKSDSYIYAYLYTTIHLLSSFYLTDRTHSIGESIALFRLGLVFLIATAENPECKIRLFFKWIFLFFYTLTIKNPHTTKELVRCCI